MNMSKLRDFCVRRFSEQVIDRALELGLDSLEKNPNLLITSNPKLEKATVSVSKRKSTAKRYIDWSRQPLGKMPDTNVARMLRCHVTSVRMARVKRHIRPYRLRPGYSKPSWK